METLPVLTSTNRADHAEWHAYFERVYGEAVTSPVNLNTFTWFYHWALPAPMGRTVSRYAHSGDVPVNGPWVLVQTTRVNPLTLFNILNPETVLSSRGFFVNRRLDEVSLAAGSRVEILRVSDVEVQQRWFYVVRGSGVFIDLPCAVTRLPKPDVPDWRVLDGLECGASSSGSTRASSSSSTGTAGVASPVHASTGSDTAPAGAGRSDSAATTRGGG